MQGKAFHVRRGRDGPLGLVPATADNPLPGLGLLDRAAYLRHNFVPGAGFAQVETHAEFADAREMPVAFDKPGIASMPCRSITFVLGADPPRSAIGTERGNLAGAYRDRLCGGRGVHGDDLAVAQDEIRGLCLKRPANASGDGQQYAHGIRIQIPVRPRLLSWSYPLDFGQTTPWSFFATGARPLNRNFCTRCPR